MSALDEDYFYFEAAALYDAGRFQSMLLGFADWGAPVLSDYAGRDDQDTARIIAAEAILGNVRNVREDTSVQLKSWDYPVTLN